MDDNITLRAIVIVGDQPQCNYQNIIVRGRIHNIILYYDDHAYHQRKDEPASERVGELTAEGER